ncbi:hypothetical protein [Streptomyces sp. NBC_00154]|uniref:hypothetical protein n=1 Tax=Streptomyces sp. NBC_00154 TaxID=2975670 RepID=UPI00225AE582|nr:hypothetical protein [Streptomyces sp. NBC_00154]MCX5318082.1 hypothetical protein [Streptomyces sp. NBC_00154]
MVELPGRCEVVSGYGHFRSDTPPRPGVTAAVQTWLVDNDHIEPATQIVGLEIRAWMPRQD